MTVPIDLLCEDELTPEQALDIERRLKQPAPPVRRSLSRCVVIESPTWLTAVHGEGHNFHVYFPPPKVVEPEGGLPLLDDWADVP